MKILYKVLSYKLESPILKDRFYKEMPIIFFVVFEDFLLKLPTDIFSKIYKLNISLS